MPEGYMIKQIFTFRNVLTATITLQVFSMWEIGFSPESDFPNNRPLSWFLLITFFVASFIQLGLAQSKRLRSRGSAGKVGTVLLIIFGGGFSALSVWGMFLLL